MPAVHFEPLHPGVAAPSRATAGSSGYDLAAYLAGRQVKVVQADGTQADRPAVDRDGTWSFELGPTERALVPLGFKARLPDGYEAQIRPRSGTSFRKGLTIPNAPGTIDADFPSEWMVIVGNGTSAPLTITHGERIAQAVLSRYEILDWSEGAVAVTTDRAGGFGSTGA